MIKQILGDGNGLLLETRQEKIFLAPSRKKVITVYGKNTTEYDMKLYLSLSLPFCIKSSLGEFDFTIPAEGNSRFDIDFSLSDDSKLFMGEAVCELKVCDRVLEWENVYEIPLMCEMAYSEKNSVSFSAESDSSFSSKGAFWLDGKNNALFEIPLQEKKSVLLVSDEGDEFDAILDGIALKSKDGRLSLNLNEGLNKLAVFSENEQAICVLDSSSEEPTCLNTLNPKFFI